MIGDDWGRKINMNTEPELIVGGTYALRHVRFGRATVKILGITDEWIDTEVVSGVLRGMRDEWHPGDEKTVRREHCHFTVIP